MNGRSAVILRVVSTIIGFSLLCTACLSNGTSNGSPITKSSLSVPTNLITPGTLTVGSDTTYPPREFIDPVTHQAAGFDIDLITAMAQRMGLKVVIKSTNFGTIITDLEARRYDLVVSSQLITEDREKQVDFVPYFNSGASLLVQKGNPQHIQSIADLCGQTAGVEDGTVALSALEAASNNCLAGEKPSIKIKAMNTQADVIQLLLQQRVVTIFQDSPVSDYYISIYPGRFEVAGTVIRGGPEGISVRKGDRSMFNAVQQAFDMVRADGTYDRLFKKWQLDPIQEI